MNTVKIEFDNKGSSEVSKRKLIIDTDPGIDDAIALMLVEASGVFELMGLTAVYGNSSLQNTVKNLSFLRDLYKMNCNIAVGASRSILVSKPTGEDANGLNGLGGYSYPAPTASIVDKWAWDFIYETAKDCEGDLELLTLGPLTNIATAVLKYPMLAEIIKKITVMAGSSGAGNATPYAEYNAYRDAHALSVVLEAGFRDLVIVDLRCCMTGYLTDAECDRMLIVKSHLGPVYEQMRLYQRKYRNELIKENAALRELFEGKNVFCDSVAAAVAVKNETEDMKPYYVGCEVQSSINYAQTVIDWNSRFNRKPNARLASEVNRDEFSAMVFDSFNFFKQ